MASALENIFIRIDNLGVTDVLLPFVLVFTIVFAVLQKTEILGKGKKNFNVIIALAMAFAVIIPHITHRYPPGSDIVIIMNNALPNVSIILVAVIMLLLLVGIWGSGVDFAGKSVSSWIVLLSVLAVVFIFGSAAGWFGSLPRWLWWIRDPDTQALVIIILVFGIIINFITKEDKEDDQKKADSAWKDLGKVLQGSKK